MERQEQCDQKKLANVDKSCPKMIDFDTLSLRMWEILEN